MRLFVAAAALALSAPAFAAPSFPVTLEGAYCGLGPCLPIVATLNDDNTCSVDLLGECTWEYSRRRRAIRVVFAEGVEWIGARIDTCFVGPVEGPGVPADELEMCLAD